jgi:hypothetical protein
MPVSTTKMIQRGKMKLRMKISARVILLFFSFFSIHSNENVRVKKSERKVKTYFYLLFNLTAQLHTFRLQGRYRNGAFCEESLYSTLLYSFYNTNKYQKIEQRKIK